MNRSTSINHPARRPGQIRILLFVLFLLSASAGLSQQYDTISQSQLKDKIKGYWLGQLVGNYMGFPFEFVYTDEPIPVFIDRYYTGFDSTELRMNSNDHRGYVNILGSALEGAWTDDDTDIEFVTLHAVEQYGLDITYPEITKAWKKHINRFIWVSNHKARQLMDQGLVAPVTGSKENNPYWYAIDPQLVNEIWSMFYPGMTNRAVERAQWGARITSRDWGTHPTLFYAALYSAAVFEKNIDSLYHMAMSYIPDTSPFKKGLQDVKRWHREHENWRDTRALIKKHYHGYPEKVEDPFFNDVSAMVNGLCGAMAILYGEGDFIKTTGIAVTSGYDCDNQAATCAGLMGVLNGSESIPKRFTHKLPMGKKWDQPFNNQYINYSRDGLPVMTPITDIIDRIYAITEKAILQNEGKKLIRDGRIYYKVKRTY